MQDKQGIAPARRSGLDHALHQLLATGVTAVMVMLGNEAIEQGCMSA